MLNQNTHIVEVQYIAIPTITGSHYLHLVSAKRDVGTSIQHSLGFLLIAVLKSRYVKHLGTIKYDLEAPKSFSIAPVDPEQIVLYGRGQVKIRQSRTISLKVARSDTQMMSHLLVA